MRLDAMLERCRRFEERAASLYHSFAAASRADPALCALWTALARDEEEHADSIAEARARLEPAAGSRTWLDGWSEAVAHVDDCLRTAEELGDASTDRQLSAALELERSELEALRRVVLATCRHAVLEGPEEHSVRLAEAAERFSDDPHVRLQGALLRARVRLKQCA